MSITTIDTHKLLFGKKGIADASVVEMAEHGRGGGVSTGQPFKFTDSIKYEMKMTEDGEDTYIGIANPGTLESEAKWQAMKLDGTTGLKITFADRDENFDNVATDLTALDYS